MIQVSMKEWRVITFIQNYRQQYGCAPSHMDIATGCAMSDKYAARRLITKLEKAGVVRRCGKLKAARTLLLCKVEVGVAV